MSTFARFLLVGGALAALYALLAALATSQLPWPKAVSAAVAWLACIPLGFWCHRRFTFPGEPYQYTMGSRRRQVIALPPFPCAGSPCLRFVLYGILS